MNAWMSRYGVQGSSLPGLMITGVLREMAGIHREFTAGELLGITRPRAWAVGKKARLVPNCSPRPLSRMVKSSPRESPLRISGMWVRA